MPLRVLFLTASVGVGHTAAAQAVERALGVLEPGTQTRLVDSYKYAASIFSKVVADGYIGMVKTVPQVYRFIYDRAERAKDVGPFRKRVSQFTASNLRALIEAQRPDVVVCTHAFPCGVMAEYKRLYDPGLPVMGIVTDFVVHPFWIYRNIDAYAVPTNEMRAALVARGVRADRIIVSGIPVDPRFGAPRLPAPELRRQLDLPLDRKVVLMMGGGLGIGPLDVMLRALGRLTTPVAGAVVIGRNAGLERRALAAAARATFPLRVVGFIDNVYDYMHASDVLVTKPGGLTSSEALAAALPMVLIRPLPGQEERNTRFLVFQRAAIRIKGERALAESVAELLGSNGRSDALRSNMRRLRRPDAAAKAAERVIALAHG